MPNWVRTEVATMDSKGTRTSARWSEANALALAANMSGANAGGVQGVAQLPELQGVRDGILRQRMDDLGKRGESLKIIVVGESGVGKTTLLSNIFGKRDLIAPVDPQHTITAKSKGIVEKKVTVKLDEVPFTVTLTDTQGFGDSINLEESFRTVTDYMNACNESALKMEHSLKRSGSHQDELIDAVLYFFAPHRLKEVDLEVLKRIEGKAPVIPILAKSDTMTAEELGAFRNDVIRMLDEEGITYFHEPFAVVASVYTKVNDSGTIVVGREYPWGFVEVENEDYSDLAPLRRCLLTDGLAELKNEKLRLYEAYRMQKLRGSKGGFLRQAFGFVVKTTIRIAIIAALVPLCMKAERDLVDMVKNSFGEKQPIESGRGSDRRVSRESRRGRR